MPLDTDKHEIRLLHLEPAPFADDIKVRLETVSLDDVPNYEALSYAWGTMPSPLPVLVDVCHFLTITENLDWALRCLRYRSQYNRVLWIDALCINQNDLEERKHQVQLMRDIYRSASDVVIWLGADENRELGRLLRHIIYGVAPASLDHIQMLKEDVIHLSRLPWFSRVWVVQELALSSHDPRVYIGRRHIRWSKLALAVEHFSSLMMDAMKSTQHTRVASSQRFPQDTQSPSDKDYVSTTIIV
ncbi:heterokaryon incompatibility protein [Stagonosporopsis vannaccii]|nr:heterokaryon incompatibility protein [Stagonosporopsis vannaccii]